ncbi:extracellular matrix-binding ebh [Babesia caballi]|uniref:Extracellular matrix-binding ebh n=1 Tax=Babesia caballi TaxID=5871 RepID=A0AAV4LR95_BABCB|nr:extracellular matrix-binding ebh [Babesia caballi]
MLYFLAALPFTAQFTSLETHIGKLLENDLDVADSSTTDPNNKLTKEALKSHLLSSCLFAPALLGVIQGHSASDKSEPWLHELFSNSDFNLSYPSGPALFNALSSYTYALQFQVYFLYQQCGSSRTIGCGWNECRYGKSINTDPKNKSVQSHICRTECTNTGHNGDHSQGGCQHTDCGKESNNSPLQAFLTDKLRGFSRGHPSDPSSHLAACSGSLCHVPMGFNPMDLRTASNASTQGENICLTLRAFCGGFNTPLRQLSEKLGCLTKRTPRVLGDLFGFTWHLNGQLFKDRPTPKSLAAMLVKAMGSNNPPTVPGFLFNILKVKASPLSTSSPSPTGLSRSLEAMAPTIPFLYQLFMAEDSNSLPGTLFDLNQHCHTKENKSDAIVNKKPNQRLTVVTHNGDVCSTANDLWSLYQPVGQKPSPPDDTDPYKDCRNGNCGPYLYPLTHSDGATYAPRHASAYLSWVLYLSDDLQLWFQDMLEELKIIKCSTEIGCNNFCCHPAASDSCTCSSVVTCAGVLPVLYRHGFQFYGPYSLNGWKWDNTRKAFKSDSNSKRSCANFSQQLSSVLSANAPLAKLLETIDNFLYMFRFYFFYNLSTFWLCSLAILLYFLFYGIDVLQIQSHAHLPSSHGIPPIGLLTTGKVPALTKLTYYMP